MSAAKQRLNLIIFLIEYELNEAKKLLTGFSLQFIVCEIFGREKWERNR